MLVFENEVWTYYFGLEKEDLWYKEDAPDVIDFEMTAYELGYQEFVGKWLIYASTREKAEYLCCTAVEEGLVKEAKHSRNADKSFVCCFYINFDDSLTHYNFLSYFKEHDLLPKNKNGNFTNIAFKLDLETGLNIYGNSFRGTLHLKDFINLETGEYTSNFLEEQQRAKKETKIAILVEKYLGTYHAGLEPGNKYANGWIPMKQGDELNDSVVKAAMEKNHKTTKDVADYLEVSVPTVRNWLNKKTRPYVWNAMMIALYLNINPKEIIVHN